MVSFILSQVVVPVFGLNDRIARFDMCGFGRCIDKPASDLTFDRLIKDIPLIADAVSVAQFHSVGELIGGTAARLMLQPFMTTQRCHPASALVGLRVGLWPMDFG